MIQAKKTSVKNFGAPVAQVPAEAQSPAQASAPAGARHRMMESPVMKKRDQYGRAEEVVLALPQAGMILDDEARYANAQRIGAQKHNERVKAEIDRVLDLPEVRVDA